MTLGSFSDGALNDLTDDDVRGMLDLGESLFVEHKENLSDRDNSFRAMSAIAAFANTMGGWLLLGVKNDEVVSTPDVEWAQPERGALVDRVRSLLRAQVDPLPTFEAKIVVLDGRPVGVIRVYESADTPHITVKTGAVFIRETAGVHDTTNPRKGGHGAAADRKYEATKIGSRQQLIELTERATRARDRADQLLYSPQARTGLIASLLGIGPDGSPQNQFAPNPHGKIIVRIAPLTLPTRFRGWCTSLEAAKSVLGATEALGHISDLSHEFVTPHHCGASAAVGSRRSPYHHDTSKLALPFEARTVVDNAGVVGATLRLKGPDDTLRRARFNAQCIAETMIAPVLDAASSILQTGGFFGSALCHIDIADLPEAISTDPPTTGEAAGWVPLPTEITLPLSDQDRHAIAGSTARAYLRSAGLREWDQIEKSDV